jgi:hypothetical protein
MCISEDDGEDDLESLFMRVSCLIDCPISFTLLDNKQLKEIEAFCPWQEDKASISSWDPCKEFIHDMQGLLTQACKTFSVLDVFKSKQEPLQWDRDEESSLLGTISTLQFSSPLTVSLPCVLQHVGEVDEDENTSRPEVEATWSSS